jgi:hypothetical protein
MTKPDPTPPIDPELAEPAASFARGDFATLEAQLERLPEPAAKSPAAARLRAAVSVDGAHIAVIALCTLALIAIALGYLR